VVEAAPVRAPLLCPFHGPQNAIAPVEINWTASMEQA